MKLFLNKNSIGINELRKVCPTQRFNAQGLLQAIGHTKN